MLLQLLFTQPIVFFLVIVALVISITIHEFAHAFVADRLGDDTPRLMGRVNLNPMSHLDPLGFGLLLIAGFGWGRPVLFNPINLQNPKRDSALIALAGPASNFILASVLSLLFHSGVVALPGFSAFLQLTIFYNVMLGVFNLIPVAPLDGAKVVGGLLPPNLYMQWAQIQNYGPFFLIFLILTGSTGVLVTPVINVLLSLLGL